ncbi:MAG: helix-turn-helix transcriptional regulator [Nitrospirae bacterium]|nr:helix-turn-helix transcriptional regulator [Nitrospirota bacterium]
MTTIDMQKRLSILLQEARSEAGLTQIEVASVLQKPQSFVSKYEIGERKLSVVEFLEICGALSVAPAIILSKLVHGGELKDSILFQWGVGEEELSALIKQNPSLKGILFGYVAEIKFQEFILKHPDVTDITKDDDHDRKKKGDRRIVYKDTVVKIEVKSLQSNTVKRAGEDAWVGKSQVDASDRRTVTFPDGSKLETTCLLRNEFDLLAVNCYAFGDEWRFAFALNEDLPQNSFKKYTEYQREHLLPSLMEIHWPPQPPFSDDPFMLLDRLIDNINQRER